MQNIKKGSFSTYGIAQISIFTALAIILHYIKFFELPNGGSISLVMLPIIILALRTNLTSGMISGLVVGIIGFISKPYYMHPVQVFLDYGVAFAGIGMAALFAKQFQKALANNNKGKCYLYIVLATITAVFCRFIGHFLAGVFFYASFAPKGQSPVLYSAIYNGSFLAVLGVITLIVTLVLFSVAPKLFDAHTR